MKFSLVLLLVLGAGRFMWDRAESAGAGAGPVSTAAIAGAVAAGDAELVQRLLRADDAPTMDDAGVPLLAIAAWNGQEHVIRVLLAHGMDVNLASPTGWTPLMMAALAGRTESVETLLRAGANVFAESDEGTTALSIAIDRGYEEIEHRLTSVRHARPAESLAASFP